MDNKRVGWVRNTFTRPILLSGLAASFACGSGPTNPPPPPTTLTTLATLPPPPPSLTLPASYLLVLTPDPACGSPAPLSFPVEALRADTTRSAGVEVVLRGEQPPPLEMELQARGLQLRGGLGTVAEGALSLEGVNTVVQAVALGTVTSDGRGRGEVGGGTLVGELDSGNGACSSANHRWSLRQP
jgi:hypothetical protein